MSSTDTTSGTDPTTDPTGPSTTTTTTTPTPPPTTTTTTTTPPPTTTTTTTDTSTTDTSTTDTDTETTTTGSSTTTTTTSTTTTSTSTTPTQSATTTTTTTTQPPVIVTSTSTTSIQPTRSIAPTESDSASEGSTPFFQNTGAVAGTFTAVGVVGLIIIIVLITTTLRRRRARKFDQEIAEAAREAAATQPPVFLDDDDDYRNGGSGTYGGSGANYSMKGPYSDVSSHGTYSQPPMSHAESHGMREMPGASMHGPAPGEVFDYGAAGAAGIGVARARSQRDGGSYGQALQDGASPYPAFMPPSSSTSPPPQHPYGREYGTRGTDLDVLEAAGMGAHVAGAGAAAAAGYQGQQGLGAQGHEPGYEGLTRNKSLVSHEGEIVYPAAASTGQSPQHYGAGPDPYNQYNAPQQQYGGAYDQQQQYAYGQPQQQHYGANQNQQRPQSEAYDDDDAYGGYVVQDEQPQAGQQQAQAQKSSGMPNPYDNTGVAPGQQAYEDEDDDRPRVLKVANQ